MLAIDACLIKGWFLQFGIYTSKNERISNQELHLHISTGIYSDDHPLSAMQLHPTDSERHATTI